MNAISAMRSTVILSLLIVPAVLVAQQSPPPQSSPWDRHDPDSPWDSIDPQSVWDNPNAGKSWVTRNPYTGTISGRWRSTATDRGATVTMDWQLEENGNSIRMRLLSDPTDEDRTYVGQRRGHFIIVTSPEGGAYQCPKGSTTYPVKGIDEIGISDDGRTLTHRIRDFELEGKPPRCKVVLKDTWRDHMRFERIGALQELRYVELKGGKYVPVEAELAHGATFYVEARFDANGADPEYIVQLNWGEGPGAEVKVSRTSDPQIYRSEAIQLQPPTSR
jgi:hypothetical protein